MTFGVLEGYSFKDLNSVKEKLNIDLSDNCCTIFSIEFNDLILGVIKYEYSSEDGIVFISYILNSNSKDMLPSLLKKSSEMALLLIPIINLPEVSSIESKL